MPITQENVGRFQVSVQNFVLYELPKALYNVLHNLQRPRFT
jgi:hypothetical protein